MLTQNPRAGRLIPVSEGFVLPAMSVTAVGYKDNPFTEIEAKPTTFKGGM